VVFLSPFSTFIFVAYSIKVCGILLVKGNSIRRQTKKLAASIRLKNRQNVEEGKKREKGAIEARERGKRKGERSNNGPTKERIEGKNEEECR